MSQKPKKHYHLIVGEIHARNKDGEIFAPTRLNAVLPTDIKYIRVREIGKAQQALQLNFYNRAQDATITVFDVVVLNIVYLGHMTEDEFQQAPSGMKLQEVANDSNTVN